MVDKFSRAQQFKAKKANMISVARMATTKNSFVVYDFFDTAQKIMEANDFTAAQIWNCDETGFPTYARQCKVIAPRSKPTYMWCSQRKYISTCSLHC